MQQIVKCDFCQLDTIKKGKGKYNFCNRLCMNNAAKKGGILAKAKEKTSIKNFGYASHNSSPLVKENKRKIMLEKYGVENIFQSKEIQQQIKNEFLLNYGVEHASQIPGVREKFKQTCLDRYGVENPTKSPKFKAKSKQTCLNRYGVENPLQNIEIFKKVQRSRRNTQLLQHWKTNENLICTASYEYAFVVWCNLNQIDFDWQIPHKMPDGRTYIIDAFIKTGSFAGNWIEIKGWKNKNSIKKWIWFHQENPNNSQLWDKQKLEELKIL